MMRSINILFIFAALFMSTKCVPHKDDSYHEYFLQENETSTNTEFTINTDSTTSTGTTETTVTTEPTSTETTEPTSTETTVTTEPTSTETSEPTSTETTVTIEPTSTETTVTTEPTSTETTEPTSTETTVTTEPTSTETTVTTGSTSTETTTSTESTTSTEPTTTTSSTTTEPPKEEDRNCTHPGLFCKNCAELVQCIKIQDDFIQVPVATCDASQKEYCLVDRCSKDPNPECPPGGNKNKFQCYNTGVYPDPYSCHDYHVCVMENDSVDKSKVNAAVKCEENYGYNPVTTYCDRKLANGNCPTTPPVPICEKLGQSGPIYRTSIFYVCTNDNLSKNIVPHLFMCPHGTKYGQSGCA